MNVIREFWTELVVDTWQSGTTWEKVFMVAMGLTVVSVLRVLLIVVLTTWQFAPMLLALGGMVVIAGCYMAGDNNNETPAWAFGRFIAVIRESWAEHVKWVESRSKYLEIIQGTAIRKTVVHTVPSGTFILVHTTDRSIEPMFISKTGRVFVWLGSNWYEHHDCQVPVLLADDVEPLTLNDLETIAQDRLRR